MNLIKPWISHSSLPGISPWPRTTTKIYRDYRDEKDSPFKEKKKEREREEGGGDLSTPQ